MTDKVLAINPDHFLLTSGLGHFVYRLARKAAGHGEGCFLFSAVHARGGPTRSIGGFIDDPRAVIAGDTLPGDTLRDEATRPFVARSA